MIDPLDPFNTGWQKRLKDVERVIDTGVGMGLGVSKSLLGNEVSNALTGQFGAGVANVPMTPAQGLQNIMHSVADQFLDTRIRVRAGTGTLTMTPTDLETDVNSLDLARGQFARIQAAATDLHWAADTPGDPTRPRTVRQVAVEHARIDCRDIGMRTAYSPALEFGTIDVEVRVSAQELRRLVHAQQPDLTVDIGADGVMRASWRRAQRLGHLVITPEVVGGNLQFRPTTLRVSRLAFPTRRLNPRALVIPELPWNLRLTEVETASRTLVLRGKSDPSEGRISIVALGELPRLIRAAVRFVGNSSAQPAGSPRSVRTAVNDDVYAHSVVSHDTDPSGSEPPRAKTKQQTGEH